MENITPRPPLQPHLTLKRERQSQNLGASLLHPSKATIFKKLLAQSGLFLLILCKRGARRQKEQTERHDNSPLPLTSSFKETLRPAISLYAASPSLQTAKALKGLLSLLLFLTPQRKVDFEQSLSHFLWVYIFRRPQIIFSER